MRCGGFVCGCCDSSFVDHVCKIMLPLYVQRLLVIYVYMFIKKYMLLFNLIRTLL